MDKRIQVTRVSIPLLEEYVEEIRDLWSSRWITNMGIKHRTLESKLLQYLHVPHLSLFANGHLGLECAIRVLELSGEVITTPFTFASTTHAIVNCGLKPVFCDINPDDYTMDTEKLESLITTDTSAIVPVHVYGNICNVEEIDRIAKKHNLVVVYDAAHAFGVEYNGIGIGSFGNASMFSFHATKVFHTIEGGALSYNNDLLSNKFDEFKNFGISSPESVDSVGINAKMNEFQAAMGICNLRHIDDEISKRKNVFDWYVNHLYKLEGLKIPFIPKDLKTNYAYFPVLFDGYKKNRDQVFEELKKNDIYARKYFFPLTNEFNCYKGKFSSNVTPVAKYIADRILTLPLYADLCFEDVGRICKIIKS